MAKRRKKVDEKMRAQIIQLSKDYGVNYVAGHLGLDESTVRKYLKRETERRIVDSPKFQKHCDDLAHNLSEFVASRRSELSYSSLQHFKQKFPELAHVHDWQGTTEPAMAKGILDKMELLADSRTFGFCAECLICQAIKKQLKT